MTRLALTAVAAAVRGAAIASTPATGRVLVRGHPTRRADAAPRAVDGRPGLRARPDRRPPGQALSGELVLDTPVVRGFVADAQAAIAAASTPHEACEAIRPRFAELLADPDWLPAAYQAAAPQSGMGGGIGQWLLYRAGDGSLSLFSLVVPSGSETPV